MPRQFGERLPDEADHVWRRRIDEVAAADLLKGERWDCLGEGLGRLVEFRGESAAITSSVGCSIAAIAVAASSHHSPSSSARIAGPLPLSVRRTSSGTAPGVASGDLGDQRLRHGVDAEVGGNRSRRVTGSTHATAAGASSRDASGSSRTSARTSSG